MPHFQAEDGIRDQSSSRGLGDVYKRQGISSISAAAALNDFDLVKKGETLIIKECPSSKSELTTLIRESKANKTVLAIMKVGKRWNLVREILKKEDIINTSLIALSVGTVSYTHLTLPTTR